MKRFGISRIHTHRDTKTMSIYKQGNTEKNLGFFFLLRGSVAQSSSRSSVEHRYTSRFGYDFTGTCVKLDGK
jgi:hypothetical protein